MNSTLCTRKNHDFVLWQRLPQTQGTGTSKNLEPENSYSCVCDNCVWHCWWRKESRELFVSISVSNPLQDSISWQAWSRHKVLALSECKGLALSSSGLFWQAAATEHSLERWPMASSPETMPQLPTYHSTHPTALGCSPESFRALWAFLYNHTHQSPLFLLYPAAHCHNVGVSG